MYFLTFLFCFWFQIYFVQSDDSANCESYRTVLRTVGLFDKKAKNLCCEIVGCFTNEKRSDFQHWPSDPWCLDRIEPEFYLYTTKNDQVNQTINVFNLTESVKKLDVDKSKELFAIIHGWNTQWNLSNWMFTMKDALIEKGYNVIIVRWTEGSNVSDYFQGGANALPVGRALGVVLSTMVQYGKADLNLTTVVGFSLGAHAAGFAGKYLNENGKGDFNLSTIVGINFIAGPAIKTANGALKRIIALDPAGPMFACENPAARLAETDARFVQVIHFNGDPLTKFGRGTMQQLGHVDFYANGGLHQPGCEEGIKKSFHDITRFEFSSIWSETACSHSRAPLVFTEMVVRSSEPSTNCSFISFPCNDSQSWKEGSCFKCHKIGCPLPGILTDYGTPFGGKYYFNTQSNEAEYYCGRQYLVTLTSDVDVEGQIYLIIHGQSGDTSSLKFQSKSKLAKGVPKTRVFDIPWDIAQITRILITYTRHSSKIFKDAVKQFTLANSTIEYTNGTMISSCSNVVVTSGKPEQIYFQTCPK